MPEMNGSFPLKLVCSEERYEFNAGHLGKKCYRISDYANGGGAIGEVPPQRETKEFFSDEEVVNDAGGKQSKTHYRLDLVDPYAILALGRVLAKGVKYGKDNWRLIDAESHVNHALGHIMGWMNGDKTDDHLANAFCRIMMAIAMEKENAQGSGQGAEKKKS